MKKILVTFSLICFTAFISNAQTTPTPAKPAAVAKEVKSESTATPEAKKSGCCKNMSAAECKAKGMKDCSPKAMKDCGAKSEAAVKDEKPSPKDNN